MKPKILLYDIETSPNIGAYFNPYADKGSNIVWIERHWHLLSFAYKWLGESKTYVHALPDYKKTYKANPHDDSELVKELWGLMDMSHIVIAHNGIAFDTKKSNARFIYHSLPPPTPYKEIDTKLVAKRYFKFDSNRLDSLGDYLGVGRKLRHTGAELWRECLNGDEKAWSLMKKYNCVTPDHKLLGKDLRWKTIKEFKVGDEILGFDENGRGRQYRASIIESLKYDIAPVYKVKFKSGKEFRVTGDHKWLVINWVHDRVGSFKWKTTLELNKRRLDGVPKLFNVWEEENSKESGWLAGMYDGEGCLYHRGEGYGSGNSITITQKEGDELDRIIKLTNKFSNNTAQLNSANYGTGPLVCRCVKVGGSTPNRLEFLGRVRPERLIKKVKFDRMGRVESRNGIDMVDSVTFIGNEEIAIIGTSTRTFICDGYPMHNCQDVKLLERIYLRMRPYITQHPNIGLIRGEVTACPNCGSINVQKRGYAINRVGRQQRFQCMDCSAWCQRPIPKDEANPKQMR